MAGAGRRALLPVGLFSAPENIYSITRTRPAHLFSVPLRAYDDVNIELPLVGRSPLSRAGKSRRAYSYLHHASRE